MQLFCLQLEASCLGFVSKKEGREDGSCPPSPQQAFGNTQTDTKIAGAPKLRVLEVPRNCHFENYRFWYLFGCQRAPKRVVLFCNWQRRSAFEIRGTTTCGSLIRSHCIFESDPPTWCALFLQSVAWDLVVLTTPLCHVVAALTFICYESPPQFARPSSWQAWAGFPAFRT